VRQPREPALASSKEAVSADHASICGGAGSVSGSGTWTATNPADISGTFSATWDQNSRDVITDGTEIVPGYGTSSLTGTCTDFVGPIGDFNADPSAVTLTPEGGNLYELQENGTWTYDGYMGTWEADGTFTSTSDTCAKATDQLTKAKATYQDLLNKQQAAEQAVTDDQASLAAANSVIAQVNSLQADGNATITEMNANSIAVDEDLVDIAEDVAPLPDPQIEAAAKKATTLLNRALGQIKRAETNIASGLWKSANALTNKNQVTLLGIQAYVANKLDIIQTASTFAQWATDIGVQIGLESNLYSYTQQLTSLVAPYKEASADLVTLPEKIAEATQEIAGLVIQIADAVVAVGVAEQAVATDCPAAPTPDAPTNVSAVPGDGQATVSWSAPDNDIAADVTSYTVTASDVTAPGTDGDGNTCTGTDPTDTCTVNGLTDGDSYNFTVTAFNESNVPGPASAPSGAVTPAAVA
jgi:hypothetical protein